MDQRTVRPAMMATHLVTTGDVLVEHIHATPGQRARVRVIGTVIKTHQASPTEGYVWEVWTVDRKTKVLDPVFGRNVWVHARTGRL